MNILYSVIVFVCGSLFGNISTGYFVAKKNHVDIMHEGSGNVGSTNAMRTMGTKKGLITLLGDIVKAVLPLCLVRFVFFKDLSGLPNGAFSTDYFVLLTGLGVVVGHCFPFWLHFKGGKGIASTGGSIIVFNPLMAGILFSIFCVVVAIFKYVSLGSLIAILGVPVAISIMYPGKWVLIIVGALYTIVAYYQHRGNIERLIKHNERKFSFGKKDKKEEN